MSLTRNLLIPVFLIFILLGYISNISGLEYKKLSLDYKQYYYDIEEIEQGSFASNLVKLIVSYMIVLIFIVGQFLFQVGFNLNSVTFFIILTILFVVILLKDILLVILAIKFLYSEIKINYKHYRERWKTF